ncbi:MAG: hypothetical protein A4S12_03745 [Proteobacteria bacterium SG_bin5]|nr:MAG: hypothetical protein A4S12_03745 [Proteobacteria bacterium SG_bin5]
MTGARADAQLTRIGAAMTPWRQITVGVSEAIAEERDAAVESGDHSTTAEIGWPGQFRTRRDHP